MILEIKQYLNGENTNLPNILQQMNEEEGYQLWKNVIFKMRKLNDKQIEMVYNLFNTQYIINQPDINDNDKLTQYLQLCRLCENFTSAKYIKLEIIYQKLIQQNKQFIYDKLILLGQYELLFKYCDENQIQNLSQIYLKKFIKFILINKSDEWERYKLIIIEQSDLLLKVMLSSKMKQNTEKILYQISKLTNSHKNIFDSLVMNWSNKNFIKNASFKTQLYVSNLIVLFIQDDYNNDVIHDGIQKRLNNQTQILRKCGMIVWQAFVQSLKLQTDVPFDELSNEELNSIWNEDKVEVCQIEEQKENVQNAQIIQANDDFYDFEMDNQTQETIVVKNLYDCVLALRSEDQNRIDQALKHLPYLIRNGLDLNIHGQTLSDILLLNQDWKNHQELYRMNSLVALSIMRPQITDHLLELYFGESVSLFQRIFILKIIRESAIELSSNPNKYQLDKFDQFERSENQTFYFKQISTTYKSNEERAIKQRPEPISRRWGHTKRAFEGLQIVQPYVNRFHQLTEHLYFPLLVYSETKHKLLLTREPLLMLNFLEVILKMLDCGQNALHINKMISEAIEFLEKFDKNKNIEIILMKLRIILKITILQKNEYDERILKILQTLKHDDPQVKRMFEIIVQNL